MNINFFNINSLDRFLSAQEQTYEIALKEIEQGHKRSHWMWYVFPQLRGFGMSHRSHFYGIIDQSEAGEYLAHPILGDRLVRICEALLLIEDKTAEDIFGDIDALKLKSSMTLFAIACGEKSVFHRVLDKYFNGEMDERSLEIIYSK
jgi:uncharacterized protein (DUF1810 family)